MCSIQGADSSTQRTLSASAVTVDRFESDHLDVRRIRERDVQEP